MSVFDPSLRSNRAPVVSSMQIVKQLPRYQSDPNVLITPYGLHKLGFAAMPDAWLFHAPGALTSAQIAAARRTAASAGLVIETRAGTEVVRSAPELGDGRGHLAGARRPSR